RLPRRDLRGARRERSLQEGTGGRDPGVHGGLRAVRAAARAGARDPHAGSERRGERRADPRLPRGARPHSARLSARGRACPRQARWHRRPYGTALKLIEWIVAPVRSMKSKRATAGQASQRSYGTKMSWVIGGPFMMSLKVAVEFIRPRSSQAFCAAPRIVREESAMAVLQAVDGASASPLTWQVVSSSVSTKPDSAALLQQVYFGERYWRSSMRKNSARLPHRKLR